MNRVIFLLGLYAFLAQTGTYFTPQELNFDFRSLLIIFFKEYLQQINNKIDKRKTRT
jgi:hypothetical protein